MWVDKNEGEKYSTADNLRQSLDFRELWELIHLQKQEASKSYNVFWIL